MDLPVLHHVARGEGREGHLIDVVVADAGPPGLSAVS
jgi:hypothetical protein